MSFVPPLDYDRVMRRIPYGKPITVGDIRAHFARENQADCTVPITAGIFVSIYAWASFQRTIDETPYWQTLKANGDLNPKYPSGAEAQKAKPEAEGHTVIAKGRPNIRYFVKDHAKALFELKYASVLSKCLLTFLELDEKGITPMLERISVNWEQFSERRDKDAMVELGKLAKQHIYFRLLYMRCRACISNPSLDHAEIERIAIALTAFSKQLMETRKLAEKFFGMCAGCRFRRPRILCL